LTRTNPDALAELEEERKFLLRSLADLEREHDAGDVDDVDYQELRDGYTVRAAHTLRAIESGRAALLPTPAVNWKRRAIAAGLVVALFGGTWWALSESSAQRIPGAQITGADPRSERQQLLAQARQVQFEQPGAAAALYAEVLKLDPENVEALTYRGWTLALDTTRLTDSEAAAEQLVEAIDSLDQAVELDPDDPEPRCFLGIIQVRFLDDPDGGRADLETCLAGNPPADVRGLIEGLLAEQSP
jgi:tetratricopeptide (TPR) repeat protein